MSDLNKLMEKLKKNDPVEEVEETAQKVEETPKAEDLQVKAPAQKPVELETFDPVDLDEDDLDDDDDDPVEAEVVETPKETPKVEETPKETKGLDNSVEHEVALLQNDGIFRRELIITLKELVDVQKVNTQALLDLKDIAGGNNGKKTTK